MAVYAINCQQSDDDYDFIASKALVNDEFVGLVPVQENQKLLADARGAAWLKLIAGEFELGV